MQNSTYLPSDEMSPKDRVLKYIKDCAEKSIVVDYDIAYVVYCVALQDKIIRESKDVAI